MRMKQFTPTVIIILLLKKSYGFQVESLGIHKVHQTHVPASVHACVSERSHVCVMSFSIRLVCECVQETQQETRVG